MHAGPHADEEKHVDGIAPLVVRAIGGAALGVADELRELLARQRRCDATGDDEQQHDQGGFYGQWCAPTSVMSGRVPSASCSCFESSSRSQRLTTMVATPLPMRFVSARHSLMNLSMPSRIASDWIGMSGMMVRVAASVTKPAPVTPEAPLDVSMAMSRMVSSCPMVRSVLVACARNSVASVM